MLKRSGHLPSASCSAHVGSFQLDGGGTSTQLSEQAGFLHGALVGARVGAFVGAIVASTGHGSSSGTTMGAEVGAEVGAMVGALVGWHATQIPQVCSQMPSAMLKRSGHLPSASCSAHVGSFQCEGGCTSGAQLSEQVGFFLHGALVGAMVGAAVGAAVDSSGHGSSSTGAGSSFQGTGSMQLQMPHVHSQSPSARLARSGHLPVASWLAHVALLHPTGGCTSAQPFMHGSGAGRRFGTIAGAEVGAEVGRSQAVHTSQVSSQKPSAALARSRHFPFAFCSAHVEKPQCDGGCTSPHRGEQGSSEGAGGGSEEKRTRVGAMVGAMVTGSTGGASHATQMPQVDSQ